MSFQNDQNAIGFTTRQVTSSVTDSAVVPALIENAGSDTKRRFVEFSRLIFET